MSPSNDLMANLKDKMAALQLERGKPFHKVRNWASVLEDNTREQAERTASMPFVQPHLALMPDAHLGKGATIGSVIPTRGAIMPAAVGVDIGCGMMAVKTQFEKQDVLGGDELHLLREGIEVRIPLGAGKYNTAISATADLRIQELSLTDANLARIGGMSPNWKFQLGTLGSGNHFIEVVVDEEDAVWLFLHSGSRGVGNKIATYHIQRAQKLCKQWYIELPDPDLAYLVEGDPAFGDYIRDMNWAQKFAMFNRQEMMDRVIAALGDFMHEPVEVEEEINCHHNFTQKEVHMGYDVWISRKGAISARNWEMGLIPGSMGTASYVVRGLGNVPSFTSSPHGAGRVYSRTAARKTFSMEELQASMQGIEWRESKAFLDEIPGAYKDIDVVMADAKDLVEIVHTFKQIVNVKGE